MFVDPLPPFLREVAEGREVGRSAIFAKRHPLSLRQLPQRWSQEFAKFPFYILLTKADNHKTDLIIPDAYGILNKKRSVKS